MQRTLFRSLLAVTLFAMTPATHAATTTYTNRAQFEAALSSFQTETFDGYDYHVYSDTTVQIGLVTVSEQCDGYFGTTSDLLGINATPQPAPKWHNPGVSQRCQRLRGRLLSCE